MHAVPRLLCAHCVSRARRPALRTERAPRFELGWHGLEGRLLASRNTHVVAVPTDAARAARSGLPEPMFGIEPNPPRYQRGARPPCCRGQIVEMLGNAPSRSACKANQQPSASIPVAKRERAGRQRIERCPSDLESDRPPWPAPSGERFVRESNPPHSLDRGTATPVASRSRALPARVERARSRLRKSRAGPAGESLG